MTLQQRISVQQPPRSGNDYPFLSGGEQLATVLLDMAIEHPSDAKLPLRLTRAENLNAASAQANTMRLVILDREDAVVFDTTTGTYRSQHLWGDYYATYTWTSADNRILRFTVGSANQSGFPALLTGINIVIDPRTYLPVLPGIKQLNVFNAGVKLLEVTGNEASVRLRQGYNTTYAVADDVRRTRSGNVAVKAVTLSSIPQRGLGQYPGCGDQENPFVRTVNQQIPAAAGSSLLSGDPCFRVEPGVTFDSAGVATIVHGQINLFDDCQACCNCEDYLRPYYAIQRSKRRVEPLAKLLEGIRKRYVVVKDRLESAINCLLEQPLRLDVSPGQACQLQLSLGVFNGGVQPMYNTNLQVYVLWQNDDGDWFPATISYLPPVGLRVSQSIANGQIPLQGNATGQIRTQLDCIPPGELHRITFGIGVLGSRKVKVCLGFQDAASDKYICRNVNSVCV